jgi:hypothetical protein
MKFARRRLLQIAAGGAELPAARCALIRAANIKAD